MAESKIYKVWEVAKILRVGKTSVYELIKQNKLKCVRVGKNILIPESFLNEFIESGGSDTYLFKDNSNDKLFALVK